MNYVKSALAGLAAVFVVCGIVPLLMMLLDIFIRIVRGMSAGGFGIAFGPITWTTPSLKQLVFFLVVFSLGFFWELRRLRKRRVLNPTL